jgi:hypothetical protein
MLRAAAKNLFSPLAFPYHGEIRPVLSLRPASAFSIGQRSRLVGLLLAALFVLAVCSVGRLASAQVAPDAARTVLPSTDRLPGVDLAEGVSQLTGVAISPLLGVSSVGLWRWWQTPEAARSGLPWFCHPIAWGVGFSLLGLCFLKDFFGTAAPPLLKKPFDVLELFENKISGLIACSAFLPFAVAQFSQHLPQLQAREIPKVQFASMMGVSGFDPWVLVIPLAVAAFLVVWLFCHAINVLVALSPFGFIDAGLKLFKLALLSTVVGSAMFNPYAGEVVSLLIIFIASLLASWAFRLTVFGTLFGLDVLLPRRARRRACPTEPHAFLAHALAGVPVRTYGRLVRDPPGEVTFVYRPWLILPRRTVPLPSGQVCVAKGLLFPSLLHQVNPERRRMIVMFLPRYRSQETAIASYFQIAHVEESRLMKGLHAIRSWLADTFSVWKPTHAEIHDAPPV